MVLPMPTVYLTGTNRRYRFHKSADCWQLTKKPRHGSKAEVQAVELSELKKAVPCRSCYPDAPNPDTVHRFCPRCNIKVAYPCVHNGGVLVYTTAVRRKSHFLLTQPGDTIIKQRFVWPERAHMHISD